MSSFISYVHWTLVNSCVAMRIHCQHAMSAMTAEGRHVHN